MKLVKLESGMLINPESVVKIVIASEKYEAAEAFLYLSTGEKLEITKADLEMIKAL